MSWLDYWPLPWILYGALSVRVLAAASLAVIAVGFSSFRSAKRERLRVAAQPRIFDLP